MRAAEELFTSSVCVGSTVYNGELLINSVLAGGLGSSRSGVGTAGGEVWRACDEWWFLK